MVETTNVTHCRDVINRKTGVGGNKFFVTHLIGEGNKLLLFMARCAHLAELVKAASANDKLKMLNLSAPYRASMDKHLNDFQSECDKASFREFETQPSVWCLTHAEDVKKDKTPANDAEDKSPARKRSKKEGANTPGKGRGGAPGGGAPGDSGGSGSPAGGAGAPVAHNVNSKHGILKAVNKPANWKPTIPANVTGCNKATKEENVKLCCGSSDGRELSVLTRTAACPRPHEELEQLLAHRRPGQ